MGGYKQLSFDKNGNIHSDVSIREMNEEEKKQYNELVKGYTQQVLIFPELDNMDIKNHN